MHLGSLSHDEELIAAVERINVAATMPNALVWALCLVLVTSLLAGVVELAFVFAFILTGNLVYWPLGFLLMIGVFLAAGFAFYRRYRNLVARVQRQVGAEDQIVFAAHGLHLEANVTCSTFNSACTTLKCSRATIC